MIEVRPGSFRAITGTVEKRQHVVSSRFNIFPSGQQNHVKIGNSLKRQDVSMTFPVHAQKRRQEFLYSATVSFNLPVYLIQVIPGTVKSRRVC